MKLYSVREISRMAGISPRAVQLRAEKLCAGQKVSGTYVFDEDDRNRLIGRKSRHVTVGVLLTRDVQTYLGSLAEKQGLSITDFLSNVVNSTFKEAD